MTRWRARSILHGAGLDRLALARRGGPVELAAAQLGADAAEQLADRERLGHVVVGADLEADDLVDLGVLGGQQDDRHRAAGADVAADVEAAAARHHDVEDQQVEARARSSPSLRSASSPSSASVTSKPSCCERVADRVAHRGLVVGDQDPAVGHRHHATGVAAGFADRQAHPEGAARLRPCDSTPISPPITSTIRFAIERPEAEALLLERARAAVEALEDAVRPPPRRFRCRCRCTSIKTSPSVSATSAKRNGARRGRVLERVREQADQHLAQQHRVALGGEVGLDVEPRPRSRPEARRPAPPPRSRARRRAPRVAPLADRLHPRQGQQRLGQAADPLGVVGEAREEVLARLGVVLGAGAQHLDRARDAGDRVAQLVGGVGDELALGELAAKLLGAVADDGEHGVLGRQLAGCRSRRRGRRPAGRRARPRRARRRAAARARAPRSTLPSGADQRLGGGVREPHLAVGPDDHHRVVERVEDRRQPVALRRQRAERLAQRDPHRLQRRPEVGDLVAPAGALERLVEPSLGDPRGAVGQALDPRGDRARDQEADHDRDRDRDRCAR